jgi:ribonucleoside-diphosphate reductase alpha chain
METTIQTENIEKKLSQGQEVNEIELTAPGRLRVIKRNGKVVAFEEDKIKVAVTKAFLAIESGNAAASDRIHRKVSQISESVMEVFERRMPSGGTLHIEEIQDQVELQLMRAEELEVAKSYILYRATRTQERKKVAPIVDIPDVPEINITKSDGSKVPLDVERLASLINDACDGLEDVSVEEVLNEALRNLYDGVSVDDMRSSLIMSARTKVEKEPNYSFVTARILMDQIRNEALGFLGVAEDATYEQMEQYYPQAFKAYIDKGIELDILDEELKNYDLEKLGNAIEHQRDNQFTYLGLQTLYDRYFIHSDEVRYELPQVFFMRVAMGLALEEKDREERTIAVY